MDARYSLKLIHQNYRFSKNIHVKYILFALCLATSTIYSQASLNMNRLSNVQDSNKDYNDIWGYTAPTGEEYAIVGTLDEILFYDVTDCGNPELLYRFDGGQSNIWRDFKTYKNYVYGVCDSCSEGLHIFDMSALPTGDIEHIRTTTSYFGSSHNIYIDAGRLYAVGLSSSRDVTILDLESNPTNPPLLAHIDLATVRDNTCSNCYVHDMFVQNHLGYASHGSDETLTVYDFSDPDDVKYLNSVYIPGGYNHSSWIDNSRQYAYVANEIPGVPMEVIDLSNLYSTVNGLNSAGSFIDPITTSYPTPHNPFVAGDYLFISYYRDGVKIYDISDPRRPQLEGYYDTDPNNFDGCWGVYPYLDSGCLLASDIINGLFTLRSTTEGVGGNYNNSCPEIVSVTTDITTNQCDTGNGIVVNYIAHVDSGVNGQDYEIIWRVNDEIQQSTGDILSQNEGARNACTPSNSFKRVSAMLRCLPNQTTPYPEVENSSPPFDIYPAPEQDVSFEIQHEDCLITVVDLCGSSVITNNKNGTNSFNAKGKKRNVLFKIKSNPSSPEECDMVLKVKIDCNCEETAPGAIRFNASDLLLLDNEFEISSDIDYEVFIDGCGNAIDDPILNDVKKQ